MSLHIRPGACNDQRTGPSISRRLARTLALLMLGGLGLASALIFSATAMRMREVQADTLEDKTRMLTGLVAAASNHGEAVLLEKLDRFEQARTGTRITLARADGSVLYTDAHEREFQYAKGQDFGVTAPGVQGGKVVGHIDIDTTYDHRLLNGLAVTLMLATAGCAALTGMGIRWLVMRDLRPLADLARQTRAISPHALHQRLQLARPARELQPWIEQFNALMDRLERAYVQLEGFNADVAHELRTPLATLIGQTEVALSRDRTADELRDTLLSNLEEVQRLSAIVNDMLFLSHADRGAVARRGDPVSLANLAQEVTDFHEAELEEKCLAVRVEGDATLPVDASLVKRAMSNLLSNATRFASRGSTVLITVQAPSPQAPAQVVVQNMGAPIAPTALPRLFDRFFRDDAARSWDSHQQHHGLGLAIVAAIARMHDGHPVAHSDAGVTRIGFSLAG